MIRPKILIAWNALKRGVNEYSRNLKSYAINAGCENPVVSVIGRIMSTQVANSALVHQFRWRRIPESLLIMLHAFQSIENGMKD